MHFRYVLPILAIVLLLAAENIAATTSSKLAEIESAPYRIVTEDGQLKFRDASGRYLYYVELEEQPLAVQAAADVAVKGRAAVRKSIAAGREAFRKRQGEKIGRLHERTGREFPVRVRHQTVVNGFSAFLTPAEAAAIRTDDEVRRVEAIPPGYLETDRGPTFIGAPQIWAGSTSVDGTMGEGVIVGILDSGIDPSHPSFADVGDDGYDHENPLGAGVYLGDCARAAYRTLCNDKLIGIVSFPQVTDHFRPLRDPVGIDYVGHGTHVASIAAGNVLHDVPIHEPAANGIDTGLRFDAISGVAPHANIVSYQVCGPELDGNGEHVEGGPCYLDLAVSAIEQAIEHGVDVINYSVGAGPVDPWSSFHPQAFLLARKAGIVVATSAGNNGPGPETVADPANAPWLISVAAATHDRAYSEKNLILAGGDTTPPAGIVGRSATGGIGSAAVVHAQDFDNPWCSQPFPPNTFSGEIVVCGRGLNARVAKGMFVRDAGGAGMILENLVTGGFDGDLVDDFHVLPTIHISKENGDALYAWLQTGAGHTAEFTGSVSLPDVSLADVVTGFSSRGPNIENEDIRSVDVAAPGSLIYASMPPEFPFTAEPSPVAPFSFLSGTSMASPHVAGAAALLVARHPDWTPAELQSAIMLTAATGMRMEAVNEDGRIVETEADLHAEGSGSIRVDRAAEAGLVMPVSYADYVAANPREGGDPKSLNLPMLINHACLSECTWTRKFKATRAGSWAISFDVDDPAVVLSADPVTFTVSKGDAVVVTVTARISDPDVEVSHAARMKLVSSNPEPELHLPVAMQYSAGIAPESLRITAHRRHDVFSISGVKTAGFSQLEMAVHGLVPAQQIEEFTDGDPTPDKLGDDFESPWHIEEIEIPTHAMQVSASVLEATAPDLDLYIIPDNNGNGRMDVAEIMAILAGFDGGCYSAGADSNEACTVSELTKPKYFVAVHNFQGTDEGNDSHILQIAVAESTDEANLVLEDPGARAMNEAFDISGSYTLDLDEGDLMYGLVSLGLSSRQPENIGRIPVEVVRGDDDVRMDVGKTEVAPGTQTSLLVTVRQNDTPFDRRYSLRLVGNSRSRMTAKGFSPKVKSNTLAWDITQKAGADTTKFKILVDPVEAASHEMLGFTLEQSATVNGIPLQEESSRADIWVNAKPVAPTGSGGGGGVLFWLMLSLVFSVPALKAGKSA